MPHFVLFVDDSAFARAATARMLGERGLDVTVLGSREEAEAVDPCRFAAALLDLELGDGFGTDVASLLRRAAPTLPIAFLTAGGPPAVLERARQLGPVFSKLGDVDAAIGWVVAAVAALPQALAGHTPTGSG